MESKINNQIKWLLVIVVLLLVCLFFKDEIKEAYVNATYETPPPNSDSEAMQGVLDAQLKEIEVKTEKAKERNSELEQQLKE